MVLSTNQSTRYVIISPVKDEERYVEFTLQSVAQQTLKPIQWIIVNDGSTDGTVKILEEISAKYDWIKVLHRKNRGYRAPGGGVIEAFNEGYSKIDDNRWDFIVKLDGDLSFNPDYFEKCFGYFAGEEKLGIGGGTVCMLRNGKMKVDSIGDPPFHVRGATKIYRRACWEEINPLIQAPGWDTIDEVKANFRGWSTRTFPDITLIQHKATGSADGNWRSWFKNGLANYITGYHPMFMVGKCGKRAFRKPIFIASAALLAGFCSGYLRGIPQVQDDEVIRYLRRQQISRLLLRKSIYG